MADPGTRLIGILAAACAAFSLGFAGYAAWDQDWTTDEHVHLAWSERFWNSGEDERDSAGRYASTTPIHVPHVFLRQRAMSAGVADEKGMRFAARVPQLAWLAITLLAAGALAGRLGGPVAARAGVLFAALDPNLTAHASVATTDMALAGSTALALWAAIAQRQQPTALRAAGLGALIGLALTAKFSAILLTPLALGAAFLKANAWSRKAAREFAICLGCSWLVIVGAYGGSRVFKPLDASPWRSEVFKSLAAAAPRLPVPLPLSFLEGIDRSRARDAAGETPIVAILGQVSQRPLWYYFVAAWALKTPIGLMLVSLIFLPWLFLNARKRPEFAWLLAHQFVSLLFFSLAFKTQLGFRYTLMLVPITCAMAAAAASIALHSRAMVPLAVLVAGLSVAETARYWGDPLAFSNALVQPKSKAYLFLANADIDWNQNRNRWDKYRRIEGLPDNGALNPVDLRPGLNVLSTSRLAGVFPGDRFKWTRENLEPRAMAGWTHHYFDVTEEQYDRYLQEARRLSPSPLSEGQCDLSSGGEMNPPGIGTPFESSTSPPGPRVSVLCVATRKGTDIEARVVEGRFDLIPVARPDLKTYLVPGERLQLRLDPGVHLLAIVETPYRRDTLPYRLSVVFTSVRHGALLRIIPAGAADLPPELKALRVAGLDPSS